MSNAIFTQTELEAITAEQREFLLKNCTPKPDTSDFVRLASGAVPMHFKTINGTVKFLEDLASDPKYTERCLQLLEKYAAIAKKFEDITNEDSLMFAED